MVPHMASISLLVSLVLIMISLSRKKNFFPVPHQFEEIFGKQLRPSEKYFYTILRKLENRFAIKTGKNKGWFWHIDKEFKTADGKSLGFESFGFSPSFSQRARKKLKDLGLIETKRGWSKEGYRAGTYYRLNDSMFNFDKKEPKHFPEETDPTNPTGQNDC